MGISGNRSINALWEISFKFLSHNSYPILAIMSFLDAADPHYMEAQNLWRKGDQTRSDPFNGSCIYRLGCTALDKGLVEAAI